MLRSTICIVLIAITFAAPCGFAQSASAAPPEVERLLVPPNSAGPTVVSAAFRLLGISDIDDEAESFEYTGMLILSWKDPRQAFDPAVVGVREKVYQGSYQIDELAPAWYPQFVLANEAGTYENRGAVLSVLPDGTSTLVETISANAKTSLNLRRYPFDTQVLRAEFANLGERSGAVDIRPAEDMPAASAGDIGISQWVLRGVRAEIRKIKAPLVEGKSVSLFVVSIEVERQSFFVVRLVMLPMMLIVALSWCVFWMDRSSLGDRISVSFVGILTAVAYQLVIADILPHISYITLIHGFLNVSLLMMSATIVINLVVGHYDKRGQIEIGDAIDRRCRWLFPLSYLTLLIIVSAVIFAFF